MNPHAKCFLWHHFRYANMHSMCITILVVQNAACGCIGPNEVKVKVVFPCNKSGVTASLLLLATVVVVILVCSKEANISHTTNDLCIRVFININTENNKHKCFLIDTRAERKQYSLRTCIKRLIMAYNWVLNGNPLWHLDEFYHLRHTLLDFGTKFG